MERERTYWTRRWSAQFGRRRILQGALSGGVGLAALTVACGGGSKNSGNSGGSNAAAQATAKGGQAAATSAAVDGGTFRYNSLAAPSAFDPYLNPSYSAQEPWGMVANRILKYKAGANYAPNDLTFEPDVAASMPEQPDPLQVTVKLRPDIHFHDKPPLNGRLMVSQDIGYSYDRYMAVGQATNMFSMVDSYQTPDDKTFIFKLKQPSASFMSNLASHALLWIIPKEVVGSDGKIAPAGPFVGAGPFMYDRYDTDVQTSFVKNPNYFLKGLPHVDRVERPIISDTSTLDANFRSGKLSFLGIEATDRLDQLTKSVSGAGKLKYSTNSGPHIEMAMDRPPFNDLRVRQAFSVAINRDELGAGLDFIDFEYCSPAFPAGFTPFWLNPRSSDFGDNAKWYKYDAATAKQLLTAAGFPDGFETPYNYTTEYAYAQQMAELLFSQLQKVGIKLKLQSFTYTDYQNRFKVGTLDKRRYDGMVDDRPAQFADPGGYFTTYWSPKATRVLSVWDDPQLLNMINQQELEIDLQKRLKLLQDMQRYLAGGMPGVPLLSEANVVLSQPNVKNFFYKGDYGRGSEQDTVVWLAS